MFVFAFLRTPSPHRLLLTGPTPGRDLGARSKTAPASPFALSPISGAKVSIRFNLAYSDKSASKTLTTASDGKFVFSGLTPTNYSLTALYSGTAGENAQLSTQPGEVLDTNLTLYPFRKITFDYVCQTNGTRDFTSGNLSRGTLTWVAGRGGMNFVQQKIVQNISDLNLDQSQNKLSFSCFYGGPEGNGFYDADAVDFSSVTDAAKSGYSMRSEPCQVGHVYVVKTFDGFYAKLIVKSD